MFIWLLGFSKSLVIKCPFLNDKPSMAGPTLIDMNCNDLKYYAFTMSLNKYTGSFPVLSPKLCFEKETKDIIVKAFNMIINIDKAKAMADHISCGFKYRFNSTRCNWKQKRNSKPCQVNGKMMICVEKIVV